ncbi:FAD-dependent oxidoreductase [Solirubrobacter sp. CPCC 204708]|uniref:4,4'-diaponeurosporene oxygenase n=1 Tax=Solirubrobacter deserti TaxID=2282478 RepID=A0ABT4RRW3_9ACTN|nr:FAD-dependent oxidoreductase [Solirubrobacter deserti]MBE2319269.1 FAD-dependent oxidoreductase [Solirubrobacter deserti]MDA0141133.1 FAD-dependent oxidoreductase [Solirubrobacter deserti]
MKVAVVGAGVGGLAAAIELAGAGHAVTVFERADAPGGKCGRVERDGFVWDAGPSLLTMPWVFEDLGLELERVEPVTRYEFADGSVLELSADLPRALAALEAWSPGAGADWMRFLSVCASMWRASERFLTGPPPFPPRRPAPGEPPPDPRDALRVKPWWTLRDLARATARDPRLRMVIERFATYAGADPRRAPAALATAGYVEHAFGAWHPRGGMYAIPLAMTRRLEALGGELRLNTPVERITVANGRVRGVETGDGAFAADAVVTDVDERVVRTRLLGRPARRRTPSLSGLALLLGVCDPAPAHHRILFPRDYDAEFDDIFTHRRMPQDPTLYVCAPPEQGWFVLVNAPASPADWDATQAAAVERLGVQPSVVERVTPQDLGGPIYGAAPHGRLGAMLRPGNRIRGIDGLWLTGGTVHPGGGLPLVTLGGRSVARQLSGSRPSHVPSAP